MQAISVQLFSFLASVALTWFILMLIIPLLRLSLLDQPNDRSSHIRPTPRGGGFAFVLVSSAVVASLGELLPVICLPLALVGFLDDRHNLPAALRYGIQVATVLVLLLTSTWNPLLTGLLLCLFLLIAGTAIINFTNFMDGLDGLVAGCMAVIFLVAALSGMPALWPLVGSLTCFLFWNWSPAKVFMGDVGSTFLGAVFVGVLLKQAYFSAALGLLFVGTPLISDASLCVLRRLFAGQRIFQAHRLHLFQRLHQAGWSHASVSGLYIISTIVLALAFLAGGLVCVSSLSFVVFLIGVWLDQNVAIPFALASRS